MIKLLPFYKIDKEILTNKNLSSTEKLLLALIKSFYSSYGPDAVCRLSNTQFMEILGIQKQALLKALNHLESLQLIEILHSKPKGIKSNRVIRYLRDNETQLLPEDLERFKELIASLLD